VTCGYAYVPAKHAVPRLYPDAHHIHCIHSGNPTSHAVNFAKYRYLDPMFLWSAAVEVVMEPWNSPESEKAWNIFHAVPDAVIHPEPFLSRLILSGGRVDCY